MTANCMAIVFRYKALFYLGQYAIEAAAMYGCKASTLTIVCDTDIQKTRNEEAVSRKQGKAIAAGMPKKAVMN